MSVEKSSGIAALVNGIEEIDALAPSPDEKGVIVDLVKEVKGEATTITYFYYVKDESTIRRTWQRSSIRQFRLHEVSLELFLSEYVSALKQANIPYSVLESLPPSVSGFMVEVRFERVDRILSEINAKYFKPAY
jgi:hypothetical protein